MRRAAGEGSLFQRKDGLWVAQVTDAQGKKWRRTSKSRKTAAALLREMTEKVIAGTVPVDASAPVRAWFTWWIDNQCPRDRSSATTYQYRSLLERHVLPVIGGSPMGKVTALHIESILDGMQKAGLTRASLQAVKNATAAMFSDAVRAKMLAANPARLALIPKTAGEATLQAKTIPTTAQVKELVTKCTKADPQLGLLVTVCAHLGLRIGEALATKWADIDLEQQQWTVHRTLTVDLEGRSIISGSTKTGDKGRRTLTLSEQLVSELRAHKTRQTTARIASPYWDDCGLIFCNSIGRPMDSSALRKQLKEAMPAWSGGFHGLRHWHASLALTSSGQSPASVSRALGHSSTRTTMDVYGHLLEETSTAISSAVTQALGE